MDSERAAATQVFGELAVDVTRKTPAVGVAQLREHRLRVARDQLVEHRTLGLAALIASPQ